MDKTDQYWMSRLLREAANHGVRCACVALCVLALIVPACSRTDAGAASASAKPRVVCTVGMIGDIVRRIAGERAEVIGLIGSGVDPHLYKPTRNDLVLLQEADLVFYNGLLLEGRMSDSLVRLAREKPVVAVTEGLERENLLEPPEFAGHFDPHVWMDVSAWSKAAPVIASALTKLLPAHRAEFEARLGELQQELSSLHAYVTSAIASIPAEQRVLVTAHDAFNYFGRAYGIRVIGIQGISTESEAGLNDINRLVDMLVEQRIGAVFVESSVSDKNVQALIEGAASRGHSVRIGGTLFSDAMGMEGTYEGTYIGMIDHNATTIARALGGSAPPQGANGKLSLPAAAAPASQGVR